MNKVIVEVQTIKVNDTVYNIHELPLADLEKLRDIVEGQLATINAQLSAAKAKAHSGEYSDPDWFHRAQYARTMKARDSQVLNRLISKLRKTQNKRTRNLAHFFVDAARELLVADTFQMLMEEARSRKEESLIAIQSQSQELPY